MKKRLLLVAVTFSTFLLALYGPGYAMQLLGVEPSELSKLETLLYISCSWIWVPMLMLAIWCGPRRVLSELGWQAPIGTGLLMGLGCTLPMLLGYAVLFPLTTKAGPALLSGLFGGALLAGLREETLFRGFLFGQLYRHGKLPWLLVILVESGIFASLHLYQSHDFMSAVSVMAITFGGGVWFGWLFKSWKNLWVPIFLHVFMNGWWMLFEVDNSAVGSVGANVFRVLTIVLSVVITRRHLRRQAQLALPMESKLAVA
ncbi:CPBP family intramembrane glutamic endopeptidase [Hymenobacter lapidiphilus]|uniref:CPBP family intramembrane metalloprotease n=1 Tax=Hymenobacter lapidiphilus TaxID=2608003 RepID=A0A7Y7PLF1_9BACT|nr:CPBP family intramembrane glutamic endopeptidase [Hymenobacter lapidiphilus]NVO29927.1 CPBP family intramembrane metalloprotease [Hymenobacter lapidiphilus]